MTEGAWAGIIYDDQSPEQKEFLIKVIQDSEKIMEIAEKCGLSKRVIYDPEKYENVDLADPGDEI